MREKVTVIDPATALMRLLDALADELIEASDEEIMQAAKDLGMNPRMPGSAAFVGLKFRVKPRLSDFYDLDLDPNLPSASKWWAARLSKDADEES